MIKNKGRTLKFFSLLLCIVVFFTVFTACKNSKINTNILNFGTESILESWSDNSVAKASIVDYVRSVTDNSSADFIPEEDRLATFDLDGTLYCEDQPSCFDYMAILYWIFEDSNSNVSDETKEKAKLLQEAVNTKSYTDETDTIEYELYAECFSGFSVSEYRSFIKRFIETNATGFSNLERVHTKI